MIYDNVRHMLVGHLLTSPALAGRVQTAQTALHIKDRVREAKATDDLQPILQAIKTRKEVCFLTPYMYLHMHVKKKNYVVLYLFYCR